MQRIRLFLAVLFLLFVVGLAPAVAQEDELTGDNAPAVVLDEEAADAGEDAWTFRYLVPTLLGVSGIALAGVGIGYAVRIRGRYRVTP